MDVKTEMTAWTDEEDTVTKSPTMANKSDNCTDVDELMKRYYLPVCYSVIFAGGLVGNTTGLFIYLTKLRPWQSSSIIMVNLALTDLLYVLSMPFFVYYYNNGDSWALGEFMCRFVRFGFHFNLYGSILFLTCIAVFRYVVVMRPLWVVQVQQRCWGIIACTVAWIIAAAEITPMLIMIDMKERDNQTYCLDFASTIDVNEVRLYSWLLTLFGFLLPLVVVFMCYIGIVKQLARGPVTSSSSRMRARRVTVLILVVFVVCFMPYHVLRAARIETRNMPHLSCTVKDIVHAAYIISRPVAGFNTFFNLALYTLSGDKFRRAFVSTFCCKCSVLKSRSLVNLAIISKTGSDAPAE